MIPTFDIWLEDSQGRQLRRTNHYIGTKEDSVMYRKPVQARYKAMAAQLPGVQIIARWYTY
jgi:hypothetical protein